MGNSMTPILEKIFLDEWQDEFARNALDIARCTIETRTGFWHPLGFIVLPLLETPRFKYRLHISSPAHRKLQQPHWPIHDHSYDFESVILSGHVENTIYSAEFNSINSKLFHMVYNVEYNENESIMRSTDITAKLTQEKFETIETGGHYNVTAGIFHQSSQGNGTLAATLVKTVSGPSMPPRVIGDINGEATYHFKRLPVESEIMHNLIDEVSNIL